MTELTEPRVVDPKAATTEISYCPHLNLYHYKRVDGDEFFFDTAQLEASIESYLKQGNSREAEFMAQLTAWARKFPHKTATFYADGRFEVRKLDPHKNDEDASHQLSDVVPLEVRKLDPHEDDKDVPRQLGGIVPPADLPKRE